MLFVVAFFLLADTEDNEAPFRVCERTYNCRKFVQVRILCNPFVIEILTFLDSRLDERLQHVLREPGRLSASEIPRGEGHRGPRTGGG